ncbi:nitrite reductase/ring-hydroxylating ferredoxin subunit [Thermosporothrix hazakensis]|jgi:nitrite reductase/ring-hydroxylating ferredoxin subunit|uniref:Nitrite reductase/ring-hydroxylating ferredoxin subunit n=2 Tax=Thermosporothrix TaxID=768650 RepID=A0A326UBV1_THEHA|nr:Rieske (2Fe-2S) protein [Thermosporothrix hazakensis]PZW31162.1 nitrite reductase/ring-hydroxylating ferredoxin subunit [Thermosporothrix hazakensis]BBH86617.1 hypothetical protein KTC_13680 [Thermosporothrix sp. COM3]GCE50926.1 hypothetical protein KTH_57950 [Thermosporothrix hazakensis]
MIGRKDASNHQFQRNGRLSRWQALFPYHWDADEYVSRREVLRLAVIASGTLFAATAGIVGLSYLKPRGLKSKLQPIIRASDIPKGGVHYFNYPAADEQAILLHLPDGRFTAFSGRCTHLSCAVYYDEKEQVLHCPCHDGYFDPQSGAAIGGPPQRPLPRISIRQDGSMLYAVEVNPA